MKVLLIGTNQNLAKGALQCLMGKDPIQFFMIGTKETSDLRQSKRCSGFYEVSHHLFQPEQEFLSRLIIETAVQHQCEMVIPCCTTSTLYLGRNKDTVAQAVPTFPLPSFETLDELEDKWRFYQLAVQHQIPTPHTRIFQSEADLEGVSFPVIVKPAVSEGSVGIHVIRSTDEFTTYKKQQSAPFLVQEYIPGEDRGMSVLCQDGEVLAWTIQHQTNKGFAFEYNDQLFQMVREMVAATQFTGLANFDGRIDERNGKVSLIECNPRVYASVAHSAYAGVNFIRLGIQLQKKEKVEFTPVTGKRTLYNKGWVKELAKARIRTEDIHVMLNNRLPVFLSDPSYEVHEKVSSYINKIKPKTKSENKQTSLQV